MLTNVTGTFVDNENLTMPLLAFDTGSETISEGDTITGATSGKTAEVTSVVITTGTVAGGDAEGYMSVKNNSGTWTNSEPININGVQHALVNGAAEPTAVTVAKADGTQYGQTLNPGGLYEFVTYNFRGEASGITMYGVNTVDNGFSYDGTTFIKIKNRYGYGHSRTYIRTPSTFIFLIPKWIYTALKYRISKPMEYNNWSSRA